MTIGLIVPILREQQVLGIYARYFVVLKSNGTMAHLGSKMGESIGTIGTIGHSSWTHRIT